MNVERGAHDPVAPPNDRDALDRSIVPRSQVLREDDLVPERPTPRGWPAAIMRRRAQPDRTEARMLPAVDGSHRVDPPARVTPLETGRQAVSHLRRRVVDDDEADAVAGASFRARELESYRLLMPIPNRLRVRPRESGCESYKRTDDINAHNPMVTCAC